MALMTVTHVFRGKRPAVEALPGVFVIDNGPIRSWPALVSRGVELTRVGATSKTIEVSDAQMTRAQEIADEWADAPGFLTDPARP